MHDVYLLFMLYTLVSSKVFAVNLLPSIIYCQIFEFLFPKCSNGINCNCLVADMQYVLSDFCVLLYSFMPVWWALIALAQHVT
jgi:hypothetical protein